mmetsp:Transcript_19069/g.34646  ORF Transcript_19069/g.34646 Transcript_19069/m.34646 type:complete len:108 (-) Transcript_19069:1063-1386(-)
MELLSLSEKILTSEALFIPSFSSSNSPCKEFLRSAVKTSEFNDAEATERKTTFWYGLLAILAIDADKFIALLKTMADLPRRFESNHIRSHSKIVFRTEDSSSSADLI